MKLKGPIRRKVNEVLPLGKLKHLFYREPQRLFYCTTGYPRRCTQCGEPMFDTDQPSGSSERIEKLRLRI